MDARPFRALGHLRTSLSGWPRDTGWHVSYVHLGSSSHSPEDQEQRSWQASGRSCPVNSGLKTPISCLNQLISSTNAKPKSLKKVAMIALLASHLVSPTQQGGNRVVPQKTKNCPHKGTGMGCGSFFYESRGLPGSFTDKERVPGRPLCLCFEI